MDASGIGDINLYEHGTVVDKRRCRVQCNFCGKVVCGSFRLKCHIGGIRGDVKPCPNAPADVKEVIQNELKERQKQSVGKEVRELHHVSSIRVKRSKRGATQTSGSQNESEEEEEMGSKSTEQVTALSGSVGSKNGGFKERKTNMVSSQAQKCIGRFFLEAGLEFSAVNLPSFKRMINSTLGPGQPEYDIPSCKELKGRILDEELKEMQEYVEKIRESWATTGCSILLDGWIDENGRNLVNFLVNCPQGPVYLCTHDISPLIDDIDGIYSLLGRVLQDVGMKNVVQIVAHSIRGWAGTVGKDFSNRFPGVFWVVSTSHCIELILEKIGMIGSIRGVLDKAKVITKFIHGHETVLELLKQHTLGRGLIQPSKIRGAMPFMTLENIVSEENKLRKMFSSSEWNVSTWASREEGKRVADLVEEQSFWTEAKMALKAAMPVVRILDWMFKADKPLMAYIYETMDQVKETIKEELKNKTSQYMPFWVVIDDIWNNHLHNPLHGAGYYLNPSLYYSTDFYGDEEVAFGLLCCLVKMVKHQPTQDSITHQFSEYRQAKGSFQDGKSIGRRTSMPPAKWWSCYGHQNPELQRFAFRIQSQCCDGASKYGLKRTLAEKLVTNGRNPIEQRWLKDLAFLHYNLQLQQFCSGVKNGIVAEEIDPMDDWIIDEEAPDIVSQIGYPSLMKLEYAQGATSEEGT